MRSLHILIFLIFSVSCHSDASAEIKILVFGDSLSAAYNINPETSWVSLLQKQLNNQKWKIQFINASISGETTSGGLIRFSPQIAKTKPGIVILELGANDGLRGSSLETMRNNLKSMIAFSQQQGALVLLAGMHIPPNYGRTYTQKFDQIYQDLSSMEGVTLIPFLLEGVATKSQLIQSDGLHPNEKGQPIIAATVEKYLVPLLRIKAE